MFGLFRSSKKIKKLENETRNSFSEVRKDFEGVGKWVKHLNNNDKQVFKITAVLPEQEGVYAVVEPVQTPVQTGNFHDILKGLTSNERLIVFTMMNTDLKLSYEDLARLLVKERATIRGQINSIKQKSDSLVQELNYHFSALL